MTEQLPILRTEDEETIDSLRAEVREQDDLLRRIEQQLREVKYTGQYDAGIARLRSENAELKAKLESLMLNGESVLMMNAVGNTEACWVKTQGFNTPLYTHPLSVAAIEQRTAKACAKWLNTKPLKLNHYEQVLALGIIEGKWREYL